MLDRGEALIAHGSARLRVLGATLWTDYAAVGDRDAAMHAAEREIDDHRLIAVMAGRRRFCPRMRCPSIFCRGPGWPAG